MTGPAPIDAVNARFAAPGPKRILAIDGGGVRGALAVGMLRKIETLLRERHGRPDMVLADYFDMIGGTSTGAIIAAALALGRTCDELDALYRDFGPKIFGFGWRIPLIQARFDPRRLQAVIEAEVGLTTLGSAPWKTGFGAVAKRVDTASPWILTNCARAKYWNGDPDEIAREPDPEKRVVVPNRDYLLARVVQASAAAPFFFDLVPVEVERGRPGIFFDGAITPHNNPALQLALTALAPAYGFGWTPGADNLFIVSVGTGQPRPKKPAWVDRRVVSFWKAATALMSLAFDTSQLAIGLLQWLGESPKPWPINSEVGSYVGAAPSPPLWTVVRYDAPLEGDWMRATLGKAPADALLNRYHRIDGAANIPALLDLGAAVADATISADHFRPIFDVAHATG